MSTTTAALQRILDRCRIDPDTGCWIWSGAISAGHYPRVWAPDHTRLSGRMCTQAGTRGVWHAHTGRPIPQGWRVYHAHCADQLCLNPAHLRCGPTADWGKTVAQHGIWKRQRTRIEANRAIGRARSHVTPELAAEILASHETGAALAARLGIGPGVISKVRTGGMRCHALNAANNPFAALMEAA